MFILFYQKKLFELKEFKGPKKNYIVATCNKPSHTKTTSLTGKNQNNNQSTPQPQSTSTHINTSTSSSSKLHISRSRSLGPSF